jgi:hypothetical protein
VALNGAARVSKRFRNSTEPRGHGTVVHPSLPPGLEERGCIQPRPLNHKPIHPPSESASCAKSSVPAQAPLKPRLSFLSVFIGVHRWPNCLEKTPALAHTNTRPPINTDEHRLKLPRILRLPDWPRSLRSLRSLQHPRRRLPRESSRARPTPRTHPRWHPGHCPSSISGHLQRPPCRGPTRHRSEMRGSPHGRPHRAMPQLPSSLRPPRWLRSPFCPATRPRSPAFLCRRTG